MELNEEELKEIAAQLRKPEGETGVQTGLLMNEGNLDMNMHAIAILNVQEGDNVLELGMGNGFFVHKLLKMDDEIHYTGCDYSELMVKQAIKINENYVQAGRAEFIHQAAEELDFPENTFHKILTVNTLYFWSNPLQVLKHFYHSLKEEGVLVLAARPASTMKHYPMIQYGFTLYESEDIKKLLQEAGFHSIAITKIAEPEAETPFGKMAKDCLIIKALKS